MPETSKKKLKIEKQFLSYEKISFDRSDGTATTKMNKKYENFINFSPN